MVHLSRCQFLASTATVIGAGAVLGRLGLSAVAAEPGETVLRVENRHIEVDGKAAKVFGLVQPNGTRGLPTHAGRNFRVRLENRAAEPTIVHWHGLLPTYGQDGAVDGNPIEPMLDRRFALGMGQRIDLRILLPKSEGAWPIFVLREGAMERTGVILATRSGAVTRARSRGDAPTKPIDLFQETGLRASRPIAKRPVDRQETVMLDGDMTTYSWTLNGKGWGKHQPLSLREGERVDLTLRNKSMMAYPMHLHGHHFQVVAIDGMRLQGAVRDTVWVPSARAVTIAFDASNPGQWAFHCHHLYHMAAGMMTTVAYA